MGLGEKWLGRWDSTKTALGWITIDWVEKEVPRLGEKGDSSNLTLFSGKTTPQELVEMIACPSMNY